MKPREPAAEPTGVLSTRIPKELLAQFKTTVKAGYPRYHSVAHAVIVALTEFCEKQAK